MLMSDNIILRAIQKNDLPQLFAWINDRDEVLWNASYKPVHQAEHEKWFASLVDRSDLKIFGIEKLASKQLIGSCQLFNIHTIHRSAELQIRLGSIEERNQGLGTEAVKLLLKFGFVDLNLNRIYLNVIEQNERAIRSYEKCGFIKEGLLRGAAYINGKYVNLITMAILQQEYAK